VTSRYCYFSRSTHLLLIRCCRLLYHGLYLTVSLIHPLLPLTVQSIFLFSGVLLVRHPSIYFSPTFIFPSFPRNFPIWQNTPDTILLTPTFFTSIRGYFLSTWSPQLRIRRFESIMYSIFLHGWSTLPITEYSFLLILYSLCCISSPCVSFLCIGCVLSR